MPIKPLLLASLLLSFCCSLSAVSPDISLPEWYNSSFGIIDWSPQENLLVVKASVDAKSVDLHEVSCSVEQDFGIKHKSDKKSKEKIKMGERYVFMFRLQVKPESAGWLNFDLRARPDREGLLTEIAKDSSQPLTQELRKSEAAKIEVPMMLGQSIPVMVSKDIAISATPAMTCRRFDAKQKALYLWLPEERMATGIVAETFKAMKKAFDSGQYKSAAAAGTLIINKLQSAKDSLKATPEDGVTLEIPARMAEELLRINRGTFLALENSDVSELESLCENYGSGYAKAFACYNLASFKHEKKETKAALALIEKALKIIPTWPAAKDLKNSLK